MPDFEDDEDWDEESTDFEDEQDFIKKEKEQEPEPVNVIPLDQRSGEPLIFKEEDLDDLPEDDIEETDKFYLEPVE